jgi:ABC-2 type transport system permease protein
MGVRLLQYRAWHGRFRHPLWGIWPVARTGLRMLMRRRLFWALYAAGLFIFLMFFFGGYLLSWIETQIPTGPIQFGRLRADPERLVRWLRQALEALNGSQETYARFFVVQGAMVMVVLALAGAVLVGNDYLHGSVPFYLAKPLSRWHYVLGKCLAVGVIVNLLTTLPALLLYAQHSMDDLDYFTDPDFFLHTASGHGPAGVPLLLGILGYGLLLTVCLSIVLVATASWARRTMPLVLAWTTLFLFFRLLAVVLVDGLRYNARWRLIDLWNDLGLVGGALLRIEHGRVSPQPQPATGEAILVLGVVCLLCLSYLGLRTRAVEIVK